MNNIIIIDKAQGAVLVNPTNIYFVGDGIDFYPANGDPLRVRWMEENTAEKEYAIFLAGLKTGKTVFPFESDI